MSWRQPAVALTLLAILPPTVIAASPQGEGPATDEWQQAEATFLAFITPLINKSRKELNDPNLQWAEFKSDLLRKYFPNLRLFVRDRAYAGSPKIWILSRDGKILDLGEGIWRGDNTIERFRVKEVTDFVRARKIRIENTEDAIEVAKLVEELQGAPSYVGFLRINTKDYSVFDKAFLTHHYGPQSNWKYTAQQSNEGWIVNVEYVGPPSMVSAPPTYEIQVDDEKVFEDIRMFTEAPWPSRH
jgi:hypothetical protein